MIYGGEFKFDGRYSSDVYGAMIVNDGNLDGRQVGINSTIFKDKASKNGYYNYYGTERNNISFNSKISFQDKQGGARKLNSKERKEIIEWLLPLDDNFKKLEVEDNALVYYVKFGKLKWKEYVEGDILELEVETDSAYAYSPVVEHIIDTFNINDKEIIIDNYSNVETHYFPFIKIITYKEIPSLSITNEDLRESLVITNLKKNETFLINCEKEWVQSNLADYSYNQVSGSYLRLKYGRNRIKVIGKDASVYVRCEFPMMME